MKTDGSSNRTINKDEMQHKAFTGDIAKSINETKRTIDFVISNETPDRHGDVILLKGWDIKQFMENPVVLFAHSRGVPPIGKALKVWKSGGNLNATAQFMDKDISPFADSVFQMFKEGFLKAVSVGFMPKEFEFIKDEDDDFPTGIKFTKQELLEFSAVPVPSNPDALIKARTKGIDVEPFGKWAEQVLDDWANSGNMIRETYNIGKKQLELIRRKAIGETMTYQVPEGKQKELLKKNLELAENHRKSKESDDKIFKVNRDSIAYANSLIDKGEIKIDAVLVSDEESDITKEYLAVHSTEDPNYRIIKDDILYRGEVITVKRFAALNDEYDIFNAASRLLKKIDSDDIFEKNEYHEWDKSLVTKVIDPKDFEDLDVIQHIEDNVSSVFFNNAPKDLIINESLFKSSGGAVKFTGTQDNLSIILDGSNTNLNYYPYAKDEDDNFICKLDAGLDSVPIVVKGEVKAVIEPIIEIEIDDEEIEGEVGLGTTLPNKALEIKEQSDIVEDEILTPILTPMEQVNILDSILVDLEETLEKDPSLIDPKKGDKRFIRKIKFVAQYMKDLATAISPITTERTTEIEEGTVPVKFIDKNEGDNESLTENDVDEYLVNNLGPTLDKIVKQNLNKLRGQLD